MNDLIKDDLERVRDELALALIKRANDEDWKHHVEDALEMLESFALYNI